MSKDYDAIHAIQWDNDQLFLLDQRYLPNKQVYLGCNSVTEVAVAIRDMVVRGAPAIGITAAYGVVLAVRDRYRDDPKTWRQAIEQDLEQLIQARPTAVNLKWAVLRMKQCLSHTDIDPTIQLLEEAKAIHDEDIAANRKMGMLGAELIERGAGVVTHCNTGSLATGGYGTALGVIRSAYAQDKIKVVYANETRPWLQGARLTAWELVQDGIPVTLIADGASAYLMQQGEVQWVIVGADRIAANGDVANKIGTYNLAVAARHHGLKFMVVAPTSTVDLKIPCGADIPIETRTSDELLFLNKQRIAASGADAWNPVFDITPAQLVDAIVTEQGVVMQPNEQKLLATMQSV